jgi:hypothetical protein
VSDVGRTNNKRFATGDAQAERPSRKVLRTLDIQECIQNSNTTLSEQPPSKDGQVSLTVSHELSCTKQGADTPPSKGKSLFLEGPSPNPMQALSTLETEIFHTKESNEIGNLTIKTGMVEEVARREKDCENETSPSAVDLSSMAKDGKQRLSIQLA